MREVIKGTGYFARRALLEDEFGAVRAAEMMSAVAGDVPFFATPVMASTMIPLTAWLAFNDALVRRYFAHLPNPHFLFGEQSARWALTKGPYRNVLAGRTIADFVERAAILFGNYYEIGTFALDLTPGRLEASIDGIPPAYHHPHFEFNPAGYVKGTLQMLGARDIVVEQRAGYSRGDARAAFTYTFLDPAASGG